MWQSENIEEVLTSEELLGPPKYDAMIVVMIVLASAIVGTVADVIILLLAFFSIGNFSTASGVSPIILAMITFFALSIANILYAFLLGKIAPNIYARGKTALSHIVGMSILLYVFFAPMYFIISGIAPDKNSLLIAFLAHLMLNIFSFELIFWLLSGYRYSLVVLYSAVLALIVSSALIALVVWPFVLSESGLFILLFFPILSYLITGTLQALISWGYYAFYRMTGRDPLGGVFSRIVEEEKALEKNSSDSLTRF